MKARLMWGSLFMAGIAMVSSCGKKDPSPNAGISFEVAAEETTESDGTLASFHPEIQPGGVGRDITVKVLLDKALAENAVITYTVTGTASKKNGTGTNSDGSTYTTYSDFYLEGGNAKDTETLVIEKGSTEALIKLTVFEDNDFEVDDEDANGNFVETVILSLTSVVSGPAELSTDNLVNTLTIKEDDAVFFLSWEAQDSNDADLDLIVTTGGKIAGVSDSPSNDGSLSTGGEGLFLPAGYPAGTYNLSYPYYSGTSDNVKFTAYMLSNASGTLNGKSYLYSGTTSLTFSSPASYRLANINPYTDYTATAISQTMVKSGINYTNISAISAPAASGSRTGGNAIGARNKLSGPMLKLRNDQLQKIRTRLK